MKDLPEHLQHESFRRRAFRRVMDGTPVEGYALDEAAWLAVAPDVLDPADEESLAFVRPTAFTEIHQWGGWMQKNTPTN